MTDEELGRLAVAANAGPWKASGDSVYPTDDRWSGGGIAYDSDPADAAYIAAANPAVILDLLARLRGAEAWRETNLPIVEFHRRLALDVEKTAPAAFFTLAELLRRLAGEGPAEEKPPAARLGPLIRADAPIENTVRMDREGKVIAVCPACSRDHLLVQATNGALVSQTLEGTIEAVSKRIESWEIGSRSPMADEREHRVVLKVLRKVLKEDICGG